MPSLRGAPHVTVWVTSPKSPSPPIERVSWSNVTPVGLGGTGTGVGFGVGRGLADGLGVAGVAGVAVGTESDDVAIGVATDVDAVGGDDEPAPAVHATRISASATVVATRRIEAGIGCPPDGLLP
jgi:hypothetical protein